MAGIFGPGGTLSQRLAGYECRPGQLEMAEAVWRNLTGPPGAMAALLATEAGTGIGKTLAYLVPAVLSGRRVVVSTATLNLQDQILEKEIPFIRVHIDPELAAVCVKGRQNYLCLYRWQQVASAPQKRLFGMSAEVAAIGDWLGTTATGDRAELTWLADGAPVWSVVSATASQCLGSECPEWSSCFVNRLRREAGKARLLIVNHHLFFSDLALRRSGNGEVLPRYEAVIFDEAHHIEETATRYFGLSASFFQVVDLARDVEALAEGEPSKSAKTRTVQLARALASQADLLTAMVPAAPGNFELSEVVAGLPAWPGEMQELDQRFASLAAELAVRQVTGEIWGGLLRRCSELGRNLREIAAAEDRAMIYWLERREKAVVLTASPIQVAAELREQLYAQVRSVVFASATLSAGNDFSFFCERLGLPEWTETITIPTPFDYAHRTLLYVPDRHFPLPGTADYAEAARRLIGRLIRLAGGRTLVLFTSFAAMQATADYLTGEGLPYPVYVQGRAPRGVLLDSFSREVHSVLLAVASFWEGVDVVGESLSCVIIDKLPFEVPSDPVVKARIEKIREAGGNPFGDYQVPRAILTLRQGVGRLMRSAADRGVLAILDGRLFAKGYGKTFLKSLPASPVTRELAEVATFWEAK
ncbi:MAG: ATP-dependent DNA helicase [Desulfobulbaceae bacterium]|nr:ATP-dependent DNA helicase [Desulfobulbaceae bacterium]